MSNITAEAKIDSVSATGHNNEVPVDQVSKVTITDIEQDEKENVENNDKAKQDTADAKEAEEKPVESPFKKAAESGTGFAGFASVEKSSFMEAISRLNSSETTNIFSQTSQNETKPNSLSNGSWLPSSNSIFAQGSNFGSFSSRLSSTGSLFSSQAAEDADSDPEAEKPTSFLIGSQNPNFVPIQENIVTGEEDEICKFSYDGILYQIVGGKWVSRGKSKVKLNRSKDTSSACPARLLIRQPGTHTLMLNQPLSTNITSTGPRPDQPQCIDFTTMSNDKAELYALKFKEEAFTEEFFLMFNKLKEHYQKVKPATANSTISDSNGNADEAHKRAIDETEATEGSASSPKKARDSTTSKPESGYNGEAE
ncbi:hypothetical protein CONCODRAFT_2932 [Conidiobolus coronatus NRRL 28638]|uniref:RanBD1 domain-containing protein n=1 Tax=Conidiobolus coronatus (strain ATCC 28846 / CBS 209.66 / NRRL 28638) TaxID=796925 RepID=A0A137PGC4_CONC2|nr:hypothetical protein CONCODRAFT_2932 [Conidiobolus coronatus NRRL 28638]|eukprot:KXN74042.1 hypothetical protein CONCODRAFT_2932 [Conidiobolus coronatus NRRL 28638]